MAAITKKPIKPSLTPCCFSNSAPYFALSSLIGSISTSLNVVNIAVSCLTVRSLLAIVARSLDIGTRFSSLDSEKAIFVSADVFSILFKSSVGFLFK